MLLDEFIQAKQMQQSHVATLYSYPTSHVATMYSYPTPSQQAVLLLQMLLDEFMKAKQMQLGFLWSRQAAWRAFKDVLDQGLIAFTASR
jgi:hypothetical protein